MRGGAVDVGRLTGEAVGGPGTFACVVVGVVGRRADRSLDECCLESVPDVLPGEIEA